MLMIKFSQEIIVIRHDWITYTLNKQTKPSIRDSAGFIYELVQMTCHATDSRKYVMKVHPMN